MNIQTSLYDYGAPELWQKFMPRIKEIDSKIGNEKYSIQIYDNLFNYSDFNPEIIFTYWAATEVANINSIPDGMESLELSGGKYAIFNHQGSMATFSDTLKYIHLNWLPNSDFKLDYRPHFEVLDERYLGPENPESEEEIWVPIK